MEPSSETKMLWMYNNLDALKNDASERDYSWVLKAASTVGKFAIKSVSPTSVPTDALDKLARSMSRRIGGLAAVGHGVFNRDSLDLSAADQKRLSLNEELFKSVGEGVFLVIWAAMGTAAPVVGGIILVTAAINYLAKSDKISAEKRWEEITKSMMGKYKDILLNAELKEAKDKEAAAMLIQGINEVRTEQFKIEQKRASSVIAEAKDPATEKMVKLTAGALVRLDIYLDYYLELKMDRDETSNEYLANVYARFHVDVEAYSNNSSPFHDGSSEKYTEKYREDQEKQVRIMLTNVD
ncbi:hypothetical protein NW762_010474 [Fusarium torreyae]|uniref:Uncharacterized protein n=1 Tax=Fusarium torreyae TaxID=1237075 RepID=A0A9W8RVD3_9HYPO|nr:hypothetical protein NW762_010474 [Fusarium torreyae]